MAEDLKLVGVYYGGVVDDAAAVVEGLAAFGTKQSWQLQPSQAGKEIISIKNQDDEVSYTRCTG